jgi:hypothetical protein
MQIVMTFFWVVDRLVKATPITSALKMETARFSETLAFTKQSTRRFSSKEHHNCHSRENLKSHIYASCYSFVNM